MFAGALIVVHCMLAQPGVSCIMVEDVCKTYPEKMARLFAKLDLDREPLAAVKTAVANNDMPGACVALLEYYRSTEWADNYRVKRREASEIRDTNADAILKDDYTFYNVTSRVPRRPDGGLDWSYNGPTGDREWGWGLNRHPWLKTLLAAYSGTGNIEYINAIDTLLRDWLTSNPYSGFRSNTPQWRGLEVYMRVGVNWPNVFYGLQDFPEFSPATRLLMLESVLDHADYNRNFHAKGGNWIVMEMHGLESAAAYWPEFKEADRWFRYAVERLTPELEKQIYPDGAQKELTSSYHRVTLMNFNAFKQLALESGKTLPDSFTQGVEKLSNYVVYTMDPLGDDPLNNDSDLEPVTEEILEYAQQFNRPDWVYIATNGAQGNAPEGPPSIMFPWAGQLVMRSGWDSQAQWGFFDVGPLGIGHWHQDRLHLSVTAYGRELLVDGGRYTYQGGPWRSYFMGSASHNVLLVDGKGQQSSVKEAKQALSGNYAITPEYDFCTGIYNEKFEGIDDAVTHERAVLYVRGAYWLVLDRVTASAPHVITALWHFHPACTVAVEEGSAVSTDPDQGNIRVVPDTGTKWEMALIKGQEAPAPQGWWSPDYNLKEPSTCAAFNVPIEKQQVFAWLLMPAKGIPQKATVTISAQDETFSMVRVVQEGKAACMWKISFNDNNPMAVAGN